MLDAATVTHSEAEPAKSQNKQAAEAGIPRSTYHARLQRGRVDATMAALTETLRVQGLALERLMAAPVSAPVAPPPVVPVHEPEVIRATVRAAHSQPDLDAAGPLGAGGPFQGEIFGVRTKRAPRIGAPITDTPRTTLVIGDSHFHPAIETQTVRAMTLAGLHAAAIRPEHIVHIGDGSDWNSCCQHERDNTWRGRQKPSIQQDLDNFQANWDALNAPMDIASVTTSRHYCWGNHDAWLKNLENDNPAFVGIASGELHRMLADAGWSETEYGEYWWIGGVGYTHVPLNLMGRPVGGQTAENSVAMQSTRDTVFGHTHRKGRGQRPKLDGTIVTAINTASSMPEFYVGEYAQLTLGRTIDYGILEVVDFDGRIQSDRFVSMRELEHRYGAKADKILRRVS